MDGLLIAARAVHYASTITLGGELAFLCLIAGPAFRQRPIDPIVTASFRRKFALLGWASLGLAFVSGAAWLCATASTMSGVPLTELWSQGILSTVLTQTQFGQIWLLRLVLAVVLGCWLLARRWQRDRVSGAIDQIALTVSAVLLGTLAWSGHGAATPGRPGDFHLAADILHLLAAGLWHFDPSRLAAGGGSADWRRRLDSRRSDRHSTVLGDGDSERRGAVRRRAR